MKMRSTAILLCLALLCTSALAAEGQAPPRFADVPDTAPYYNAVGYCARQGYLLGNGSGGFLPDAPVTRGAVATVVSRLLDGETEAYQPWLIFDGDNLFYPEKLVTRAQLDMVLDRCAQAWGVERLVEPERHPEVAVSRAQLAQAVLALDALREENTQARELLPKYMLVSRDTSPQKHVEIQAAVDAAAQRYGAAGVQVAVIENGDVADTYAYGWATRDTDPMTADHKLRIASISKVVLGMGAMKLLEQGKIGLDVPIGAYWGASFQNPYYPNPITIDSILSHTSSIVMAGDGVSREYAAVKARQSERGGYSRVVPGSIYSWGYNNYAFGVLGQTLELAAGQTMDQVLGEAFYTPLGMDAAFESGSIAGTDKLCTIYEHGGGIGRSVYTQLGLALDPTPGANGVYFSGGLTVSAADLGKLVATLAGDGSYQGLRLLDSASVELMERRSTIPVSDGFYQCYPLRWRENIYGRPGLYYHTGSAYGVYNCMSYDPLTGDGVVVLTTGASAAKDGYGIYAVCGEIQSYIYHAMQ